MKLLSAFRIFNILENLNQNFSITHANFKPPSFYFVDDKQLYVELKKKYCCSGATKKVTEVLKFPRKEDG